MCFPTTWEGLVTITCKSKYYMIKHNNQQVQQERSWEGGGDKADFQILAKCCAFSLLLAQYSDEKRNSETSSKLLIP